MALQRSGSASNASLLLRTRNLISNAARSASREANGATRQWKLRSKLKPKFQNSILVTSWEVQLKINVLNAFGEMFFVLWLICFIIPFNLCFIIPLNLWKPLFLINTMISICLFCIDFIFLQRINRAIVSFNTTAWNQHPIRTERNWTTMGIWSNGMIHQRSRDLNAVVDDNLQRYGPHSQLLIGGISSVN